MAIKTDPREWREQQMQQQQGPLLVAIPLIASATAAASGISALAAGTVSLGTIMSVVAPLATGIGTAISAEGADQAGKAAQSEANYQAAQMTANADEQQAAAEQKMVQQNKQTAYAISNAQAAAAAGGGSATDPTVVTNLKTIAGQGEYRSLTDMYEGNAKAQAMTNQADATSYGGAISAEAGQTKMYSTILSGTSSLYDKYGNPSKASSGSGSSIPAQLLYSPQQIGTYSGVE